MTSQTALVREVLERDGVIEAYDAVYHLTDHDGSPRRITRLAARIWELRDQGLDIETVRKPGMLAVYILHRGPQQTMLW